MWCPHLLLLSSPPSPSPGAGSSGSPSPIPTANFPLCGSHISYSPAHPAWSWKLQHPAGLGQSRGSGRQQGAAAPGEPKPWRRAARAGLDPLGPPRTPSVPPGPPRSLSAHREALQLGGGHGRGCVRRGCWRRNGSNMATAGHAPQPAGAGRGGTGPGGTGGDAGRDRGEPPWSRRRPLTDTGGHRGDGARGSGRPGRAPSLHSGDRGRAAELPHEGKGTRRRLLAVGGSQGKGLEEP